MLAYRQDGEKREDMTIQKFRQKLENQNENTMVLVKSSEYGLIWYGKVKFMFGHFTPAFFKKKILMMKQENGFISISV